MTMNDIVGEQFYEKTVLMLVLALGLGLGLVTVLVLVLVLWRLFIMFEIAGREVPLALSLHMP